MNLYIDFLFILMLAIVIVDIFLLRSGKIYNCKLVKRIKTSLKISIIFFVITLLLCILDGGLIVLVLAVYGGTVITLTLIIPWLLYIFGKK